MIRKLIPSMILVLLMLSGPAFADVFVSPYGAFNFFNGLSTQSTLDIDIQADFLEPQYVEASQLDEAVSGGILIGSRSDDADVIFALNLEYLVGSNNELFVVYDDNNQDYTVAELKIDSPAIAIGGFLGTSISGSSTDKFRSFGGFEVGVIKPIGSLTLNYHLYLADPVNTKTETHDFSETSLYISFLYTLMYSLNDTFGVTGTLGWRSVDTKMETVETTAMSGQYGQEYGGIFLRLGLDVEF